MQIFHYSGDTKEFIGEESARLDPLDNQPMIPTNATLVEPPAVIANQIAIFDGTDWIVKEDYRGGDYYSTADRAKVNVVEIGPLPTDVTDLKPEPFDTWNGTSWIDDDDLRWSIVRSERDTVLGDCDWTQLPDATLPSGTTLTDWQNFRTLLRDVTNTSNNPRTVVWPPVPNNGSLSKTPNYPSAESE
jgi:hypothetical protein